uniref:Cytochrome P450 n=1 Tax=Clastoptera arizonana TaxID=38151 RepID=A0A1B6CGE4_9HEMI
MGYIFDFVAVDYFLLASFILVSLYWFSTSTFGYWKQRGIPYIKPIPIFGNIRLQVLGVKPVVLLNQDLYTELRQHGFGGFFQMKTPTLMVTDPELVERVMVKDFQHFYDRGISVDAHRDPLTSNLFFLEGRAWRDLRHKLTPTFSTGKLKAMFDQIGACSDKLVRYIEEGRHEPIDVCKVSGDFAFDVIASCAFGLQFDSDDPINAELRRIISSLTSPSAKALLKQMVFIFSPALANMIGLKVFPKTMDDLLINLVRSTIKYREDNNVKRSDFLQLMLNVRKKEESGRVDRMEEEAQPEDDVINQMTHAKVGDDGGTENKEEVLMSDAVMAANSLVFFLAGSDTVSNTISYVLLCLAQNPEVQDKVHAEITALTQQHGGKWSYQAVREMLYLEQVIQETVRLYPLVFQLLRVCTKSYRIPGTDVIIDKGTQVTVPVYSIHHDPNNYASPEKFDPERFEGNNFKPSGKYLPFGDGPRICIAMRFGVLEVKVVLARLISQFSVKLNNKTKTPLEFTNSPNSLIAKDGIWIDFVKRL